MQIDAGREQHVIVAYVNDDSPFSSTLAKGDEILEINGAKVGHAKDAAQAIVDATELTLTVCTPGEMIQIVGMKKR